MAAVGRICESFADVIDVEGRPAPEGPGEGQGESQPPQGESIPPGSDGFAESFGWIDAVVQVAHTINDKWDAVWDMPAAAFLTMCRYLKAKAEHDKREAAKSAGKTIY